MNLTQKQKTMITLEIRNAAQELIESRQRLERSFEKVNQASAAVHYIATYLEDGHGSPQALDFWRSLNDQADVEYRAAYKARQAAILNFKTLTLELFGFHPSNEIDLAEQAFELLRNS
jgi:acyl-CoA hydrolase